MSNAGRNNIILFKECSDGHLKDLFICETYVSVFIDCININCNCPYSKPTDYVLQ